MWNNSRHAGGGVSIIEKPDQTRLVIPFSVGHRMCIGKNLAMTNILKTMTTLLKTFEFEAVGPDAPLRFLSCGIDMEGPLPCKARLRDRKL